MIQYDLLKQLARQIRRPVKDLIALAPANDPFYAGCPFRERDGAWFGELWDRFQFPHGVHLRRIHYRLVSESEERGPILKPDGKPYRNTENDWTLLGRAALAARYLDMVPAAAFVDRRNDEPRIYTPPPLEGEPSIKLDHSLAYAVEYVEQVNRGGAAPYGIIARHEDMKTQDDILMRTFYAEWSKRMGRPAHDPLDGTIDASN